MVIWVRYVTITKQVGKLISCKRLVNLLFSFTMASYVKVKNREKIKIYSEFLTNKIYIIHLISNILATPV